MSRFVTAFIALILISISDLFPSLRVLLTSTSETSGDPPSTALADGLLAAATLGAIFAPALIVRWLLRTDAVTPGTESANAVSTRAAPPSGEPPENPTPENAPPEAAPSEAAPSKSNEQAPLASEEITAERLAPGLPMPRTLARWKRARRLTDLAPFIALVTLLALGAREQSLAWVPPQFAGGAAFALLLPFALGWYLSVRTWLRFEFRAGTIPRAIGALTRRELRAPLLMFTVFIVISAFRDLSWHFPELREIAQTHPLASVGGIVLSMLSMVLFSPMAVGLLHPKRPLPAGELRDRFEETARAARTRLGRVDVWDTGPHPSLNACVAGAIPRFRRVFFTDGLIRTLDTDELAGVFAHELAHSKLHHLWIYIGLIIGLSGIALGLEDRIAEAIATGAIDPPPGSVELALFLALGLFFFRFFGILSRHLESQADIFSARTTGSPWGIVSALNKIGQITGTLDRRAGWRHPAIPDRITIVLDWWQNPDRKRRFRARTRRMMISWACVVLLGIVGGTLSLRTAYDRPAWRQSVDRAEFLIVSVHERRDRPWSDRGWEIEQSERARGFLISALEELPVDPRTTGIRIEIFRTLAHCYRLLEDPWSAAMADYFARPRR